MKSVAVSEFKTHCLAMLDDVARTGQALLVVKRGKPLARIIPSSSASAENPQSTLLGTVSYLGDTIAPTVPVAVWASDLPKSKQRVRKH